MATTVYWSYGGASTNLGDPTNLWTDYPPVTPYIGIPDNTVDLVIKGSTMPTTNTGLTTITDLNSWDSTGASVGTSIAAAVSVGITVTAAVTIGIPGDNSSGHAWAGPSFGDFEVNGAGVLASATAVTATSLHFKDTSYTNPISDTTYTVSGTITFDNGTRFATGGNPVATFNAAGNITIGNCVLIGVQSGGIVLNSSGGTITLASTPSATLVIVTVTGSVNFSATGSTTWTGNLPSSGAISGTIGFTAGTTWAGGGGSTMTAGGAITLSGMTRTGTTTIGGATDVSILNGSAWSGSLTCSGNLSLTQTGTGPFSVGGTIIVNYPAQTDVKNTVHYGPGNLYTGTYSASGGVGFNKGTNGGINQ